MRKPSRAREGAGKAYQQGDEEGESSSNAAMAKGEATISDSR